MRLRGVEFFLYEKVTGGQEALRLNSVRKVSSPRPYDEARM